MKLRERIGKSKILGGAVADRGVRALLLFIGSFAVNIFIACVNAAAGILYSSIWYGALAVYYIVLTLQKGIFLGTLRNTKKKYAEDETRYRREVTKIYIANGAILLFLQAALTAAIVQMVTTEKPAQTGMVIAIANAAYSFFKITVAIVNLVKTVRMQNAVLQTIRNINFVDALVSILALTSTLICTFGDFNSMRTMLVCVSVGVSLLTIAVGVTMIVKGALRLKRLE